MIDYGSQESTGRVCTHSVRVGRDENFGNRVRVDVKTPVAVLVLAKGLIWGQLTFDMYHQTRKFERPRDTTIL